jgi:hypothetical protein
LLGSAKDITLLGIRPVSPAAPATGLVAREAGAAELDDRLESQDLQ